jgi:CMP/dCMP kinase
MWEIFMAGVVDIITLDGPSGCGKGTLSQKLASYLGYHLLDSGALYRIVGYQAAELGYDLEDTAALLKVIAEVEICFKPSAQNEPTRIIVASQDVTDVVRSDESAKKASQIAKNQAVRTALLPMQRNFAKAPGLVADGRDMGTEIFPLAQHKFYLDASEKVRAERRYTQLKQQGFCVSLRQIETEIAQRDHNDRSRKCSPLRPAANAVIIDTSNMTVDQVFQTILSHLS